MRLTEKGENRHVLKSKGLRQRIIVSYILFFIQEVEDLTLH